MEYHSRVGEYFIPQILRVLLTNIVEHQCSNTGTIPEEDDSIFVILELMDKGDLRSLIWEPESVPSWKTRLRLLLDASEGMSYLHCVKKQIHRDLKTPNILLAESKNECGLVAKIGT